MTVVEVERASQAEGDLNIRVAVKCRGFGGSNDVWLQRGDFDRFVRDLRAVAAHRNGEAALEAMSPDEFALRVFVHDRAGHVRAQGHVGQWSRRGDEVAVEAKVGFGFEIDPSHIERLCDDFDSLVAEELVDAPEDIR